MNKDLKDIVDTIKSTPFRPLLVDNQIEKSAATKLLQYYAKLPLSTRAAILPAVQEIAGTLSTLISRRPQHKDGEPEPQRPLHRAFPGAQRD